MIMKLRKNVISNRLVNRSNNAVTTEANILGGNTTLNGMDHRKLITSVNNATTGAPNQISVDNIAPNLEGPHEQQQLLQQLQKQEASNNNSNCYHRHLQPQYILSYHPSKTNPLYHLPRVTF